MNASAVPADTPWTLTHPVASSLTWYAALLALVVPLTLHRFRAKTTG